MKTYEELLAENEALAAHNSELVSACKLAIDMFVANECNVPNTIETLQDAIDGNPQQCLAEIKAEAVKAFADEIGVFSREYDDQGYVEVAKWKVQEHIAKVQQGEQSGTWLKDSNVNGGKRQGGAE